MDKADKRDFDSYYERHDLLHSVIIAECPMCGDKYEFYPLSTEDQSTCPKCLEDFKRLESINGG